MPLGIAFTIQLLLAAAAILVARPLARRSRPLATAVCIAALMLLLVWPLVRFFPTLPIRTLGAPLVACIELTGLFIPAVLLLAVAARLVPKPTDRRAIFCLIPMAAIYFVKAGWWMVAPELHDLGPTKIEGGICRQSTGYTCVAASMVTMLRARGIDATETEMARLARVEVNGGATDSRALWALEKKLAGTALAPAYHSFDLAGLIAAPKPLLVQVDWGFFVSHMVPVMQATEQAVTIGDPISGTQTLPAAEFLAKWKGNAITLAERSTRSVDQP